MTKCKNCGTKEISDKATFCGDACRKAFSRKSDKSDIIKDIKSDKLPSRTKSDTLKQVEWSGETIQHDPRLKPSDTDGHCKGCGEKQPNPLCDICHKCIAKGCTRESLGLPTTDHQRWLNECQT